VEQPDRAKLLPVSEQMKAWAAALAAEIRDWPQITQKSFFGFTALYRGTKIFGLLPRTRGIFKGNAMALRFHDVNRATRARLEKDSRIAAFDKNKMRWFSFELSCDADLHDALDCLGLAYEAAKSGKPARSPQN
jgi:hypothetical protein